MAIYNLNLTGNFCSHWGLWEAIREIFQNCDDQEIINHLNYLSISYDPTNNKLLIANKDSSLDRSSLLLGESTKSENKDTTGKFGEGYKIALLILTILGKEVVIKNFLKNEKWKPIYIKDKKYNNKKVLKVEITKYIFKKLPDNNLTWEINNINQEEWEQISEKYLKLNVPSEIFEDKNKNQILFEPKYSGCIYVNGLFVEKVKSKLKFGYNFKPNFLPLDRDRKNIEGFDLYILIAEVLRNFSMINTKNAEIVLNMMDEKFDDVKYLGGYSENYDNYLDFNNLSNVVLKRFEENNINENCFPISSNSELEFISIGYPHIKPILVDMSIKNLLSKNEKYKSIDYFDKIINPEGELKKTKTPKELLLEIYSKNSKILKESYMSGLSQDFLNLIKESEKWVVDINLKKENDEITEELTEEIQEDLNEELPEEIKDDLSNTFLDELFDDDVPFKNTI